MSVLTGSSGLNLNAYSNCLLDSCRTSQPGGEAAACLLEHRDVLTLRQIQDQLPPVWTCITVGIWTHSPALGRPQLKPPGIKVPPPPLPPEVALHRFHVLLTASKASSGVLLLLHHSRPIMSSGREQRPPTHFLEFL